MKEKLAPKCTSKFIKSREICRLLHPTVYLSSKREQQYFAIFFWQFCCAQFRGGVSLLIRQSSLFQKTPDWQLPREDTIFISQCLMSESINFNSFSNTSRLAHDNLHEPWRQYRCFCGISLCVFLSRKADTSHSRGFLLWATILNSSGEVQNLVQTLPGVRKA